MNNANTTYYNGSHVIITDPKTGEILAMASKQVVVNNGEYKVYDNTPALLTNPVNSRFNCKMCINERWYKNRSNRYRNKNA